MDDTKKRTDKKTRNAKNSSKVVDMSWAAKYLDDDWENKYSAEGAYDTRVARPAGDKKSEAEEEDSWKEQTKIADLTSTQRLRKVETDPEPDKDKAETGISDAITEETLFSVEGDEAEEPQEDESVRIRDALTDKTLANVEDAKAVRTTLFQMGFDEDLDEVAGLRDARSNLVAEAAANSTRKTTVAEDTESGETIKLYSPVRKNAAKKEKPEKKEPETASRKESTEKIASAEKKESVDKKAPTEKKASGAATIVASKETRIVRKAASETVNVEDFVHPEEPVGKKKSTGRKSSDAAAERKGSSERRRSDEQRNVRQRSSYRDDYYEDRDEGRRYRNDYEEQYQYEYMPSKSPLRFIPLVLVIALCVFGFIAAREISHDVPLNASDYSKVRYTVTEGLTDAQLAQDLESMGIIDNQLIFRIRCVFYSADYVEGTYELSPCYSTEKIINILSGYTYGNDD